MKKSCSFTLVKERIAPGGGGDASKNLGNDVVGKEAASQSGRQAGRQAVRQASKGSGQKAAARQQARIGQQAEVGQAGNSLQIMSDKKGGTLAESW